MRYCVTINDKRYEVDVERGEAVIVSAAEITPIVSENKNKAYMKAAATEVVPEKAELPMQAVEVSADEGKEVVKAPMAGGITNIKVSTGSAVKKGDILLMLEAMKMENEITAHVDGVVSEIRVSKGTFVSAGDVLVVLK
jgi:biotin carboxyl carrier protein